MWSVVSLGIVMVKGFGRRRCRLMSLDRTFCSISSSEDMTCPNQGSCRKRKRSIYEFVLEIVSRKARKTRNAGGATYICKDLLSLQAKSRQKRSSWTVLILLQFPSQTRSSPHLEPATLNIMCVRNGVRSCTDSPRRE